MYGAGGGGEYKCDGVIYADRRSLGVDPRAYLRSMHIEWGVPHRGLSPAFGVDHSTEQPKP